MKKKLKFKTGDPVICLRDEGSDVHYQPNGLLPIGEILYVKDSYIDNDGEEAVKIKGHPTYNITKSYKPPREVGHVASKFRKIYDDIELDSLEKLEQFLASYKEKKCTYEFNVEKIGSRYILTFP